MAWTNGPIELYHGTNTRHAVSVRAGIDPSKGSALTDFGRGFYCTTNLQQAKYWANAVCSGTTNVAEVVVLNCNLDTLAGSEILAFVLDTAASQFHDFVFHCRKAALPSTSLVPNHGRSASKSHYDVVIGPVAAWPQQTIFKDYDQISFHGNVGLAALTVAPLSIVGSPRF